MKPRYFNCNSSTFPIIGSVLADSPINWTVEQRTFLFYSLSGRVVFNIADECSGGIGGWMNFDMPGFEATVTTGSTPITGQGIRVNLGIDTGPTATSITCDDAPSPGTQGSQLGITLVPSAPSVPVGTEEGFIKVIPGLPYFVDESNHPWCLNGYTYQTLLVEIAKGSNIDPLLDQMINYGYNTAVVFGMFMGTWYDQNGFHLDPRDPNYSSWISKLFDKFAERKLRVYFKVFQSAQDLSDSEKQSVWQNVSNIARSRWNVFLGIGNESDVNYWDPEAFARPTNMGGVLVFKGSQGIGNPSAPGMWDFGVWEPRRDPIYKSMDDAGAGSLELQHGYYASDGSHIGPFERIVIDEPPYFHSSSPDFYGDVRWTDPKLALQLGLNIGANNAGGAFGSSLGCVCRLDDPGSAECATQFIKGLKASFLR